MPTGSEHRSPSGVAGLGVDDWADRPDASAVRPGRAHRRAGGTRAATGADAASLERLTEINLDDLLDAAGLIRWRYTPVRHLLRPVARRFARLAQRFDALVGEQGLAPGSAWLAGRMTAGSDVSGTEHVPASGPVVVLANHPGMTDTVTLLANLGVRPDLRIIALDRPFLRALPNVAHRLILLPEDGSRRMAVLRAGAQHLGRGGALLTFPAGGIEPDPVTFGRAKALESMRGWTDSYLLFARRVPSTRFVPAIVGDVVSLGSQRNPLARLRRTARDRERLAAALQVALPRYQRQVAQVAFGPALQPGDVGADTDALRAALVDRLVGLVDGVVARAGRSAPGRRVVAPRGAGTGQGACPSMPARVGGCPTGAEPVRLPSFRPGAVDEGEADR